MKTYVRAGRVVVVFVDDGQGRRLVIGEPANERSVTVLARPIVAATHKGEARALLSAVRQLIDELPDEPQADAVAR